MVAALYGGYTLVRNLLGDDRLVAERNAHRVVRLERALRIFHERSIQHALDHDWLMQLLNAFYGLAHFIVTAAVLVWLYHRRPTAYSRWRTALAVTTFLALVGYALFPLMPPRLVPSTGIIDALAVHGSVWSYEHGPISDISNQFAAMPSLHVAWALWCAVAVWVHGSRGRRPAWIVRWAAALYGLATIVTVIATGNHYVLDAVGGAMVLMLGLAVAFGRNSRRRRRGFGAEDSEAVVAAIDGDHVGGVVAAGAAGEVDREAAEVVG